MTVPLEAETLRSALDNSCRALLNERNEEGHWEGELSTSALSTATALVALGSVDRERFKTEVESAEAWLRANQNSDGGWGDTTRSFSNISTTLLCWSALTKFGNKRERRHEGNAEAWIRDYAGSLQPELIAETVKARYGKDRTFSVPILMICAICGTLGPNGWKHVLRLPYELAVFPRSWFAALRLPVVSYALPALIAIGYATARRRRQVIPSFRKLFEGAAWRRASKLLAEIQPASGGFLEAAPLTSFVTMALVAAGEKEHPVVRKGVEFLLATVRQDGSWPIDTNLATWATTLSVKSLACSQRASEQGAVADEGAGPDLALVDGHLLDTRDEILDWLLGQQYTEMHPFTNTPPGGWAWTDLSGGVPDADDTPGALLALHCLNDGEREDEILDAVRGAVGWLLDLQNRDGGMPTFCRGWGELPFDRSSPDLTAHTLRAWHCWESRMPEELRERIRKGREKAIRYLRREQHSDGSWAPLWFGNQHRDSDEENPTYGTAMIVRALDEIGERALSERGVAWLVAQQNSDGGWGAKRDRTPSSIEETSLALAALAERPEAGCAVAAGTRWLLDKTENGTTFEAAPIGFYFAKLWYFERSYPYIWATEAISRVMIGQSAK